jgi:hypothetical protein
MATTMSRPVFARALALALALALAGVLVSSGAAATDFYVSARDGSDAATGRTQAAAYATLAPLQGQALAAGDRVLLRCGDRFTGPLALALVLRATGAPAPVTGAPPAAITGYGPDCAPTNRPVIDGRVPVAVSIPLAGGRGDGTVWSAGDAVVQVFEGDEALPEARWPARGWALLPAGATPAVDRLARLPGLPAAPLAGARMKARTQEWYIEEAGVAADDGRLLAPLQYPLRPRTGVILTGKAWMVATAPAWAWDAIDHTVTARRAGRGPLSQVFAGPLLRIAGHGSIDVDDLVLDAAGGTALDLAVDGQARVRRVSVRRAHGHGIAAAGAERLVVEAATIDQVGMDAIFVAEVKETVARGNRITGAGLWGVPRPSLGAIYAQRTARATITDNVVSDSAYHGIRFAGDARVLRNVVSRSCQHLSDCGALYTWRRNAADRRPASEVAWNVIDGAAGDTSVKLGVNDWFAGIYLDDHSNGVRVHHNVIAGVNQGIYLHDSYDDVVRDNLVCASLHPYVLASARAPDDSRADVVDGGLQRTARCTVRVEGARVDVIEGARDAAARTCEAAPGFAPAAASGPAAELSPVRWCR